jgi:hypothetical protein
MQIDRAATVFCAALLLSTAAPIAAAQVPDAGYGLIDSTRLPSLAASSRDFRLDTAIDIANRQQIRLSTAPPAYRLPASGLNYDPARATYRYTVMERESWAWRVGLTSNLHSGALAPGLRNESLRFGALPMLHMAGDARIAERWRLGVDADTLMTARGSALDFGLQLNYQAAPNFSLFGGYRLSNSTGEGEEIYGNGFSNAANVGMRLRF